MIELCTDKYLQHSSIIWPVWLNGCVFVYKLSGCGVESSCSHLNFRFRACFERGVPWHSGNYRVWIHSERRPWHDKNIQSLTFLVNFTYKIWPDICILYQLSWCHNPTQNVVSNMHIIAYSSSFIPFKNWTWSHT